MVSQLFPQTGARFVGILLQRYRSDGTTAMNIVDFYQDVIPQARL
jgi:hypothetical protein